MIIDRINNWFNLSKQYFFTYSDGFFNLSYLSNSPEVMLRSFSKMPFIKHNKKRQMLHSDTPFVKGQFSYAQLEEGLWIFYSDMKYKNNLSYKPVYDSFLPVNYYFVSLNYINSKLGDRAYKFNNFKITNHSLSFSKPGTDFLNCHFKDTEEHIYMLYFSEEWTEQNLIPSISVPQNFKNLLSNTAVEFLNYNFKEKDFHTLTNGIYNAFHQSESPNTFDLKKRSYEFLELFFQSLKNEQTCTSNQLSHGDRIKIQKVEHYLNADLHQKFPGIDFLAKKFKISPTKLKENFKILFGKPIYGYFQDHKMKLAFEYLKNGNYMIKDIAQMFHYENASKFSKAFQKCHGVLPSEIE